MSEDDRQLLSEVGEPDPDDVGWCHAPVGELTAMVLDLDRPDALDVLDEESGDWLALGENLLALWSDNGRRVALLIDDFELHSPFERSTVIATAFLGLVAKGIGYSIDLIAFLALPPYTESDSGEDGATTSRLVGIEERVAWWKQLGFTELAGGLVVRPLRGS